MSDSNAQSVTLLWRRLYQHKQQWYRHLLSLIVNYHFITLVGHFLIDWGGTALVFGPSPSRPLFIHLLAIVLSFAARLTWNSMFRDPAQFAGIKRPGYRYRWTVMTACGVTTVPNLSVHVVLLRRNFQGLGEEDARLLAARVGAVASVLQIWLWILASAGCVWMVWRCLLDWEDETYEPCVTSELYGRGLSSAAGVLEPRLEPYSDTPHAPVSHGRRTASNNLLARAYAKQRREVLPAAQEPEQSYEQNLHYDSTIGQEQGEGVSETQDMSISSTPAFREDQHPTPLRCPTVARYDYMSKNHIGAHSWLSDPLIPAIIFTYSTLLSIPMIMFINDTRYSTDPSPKATKGLIYTVLGSYLLCLYGFKHCLRRQTFEKFQLPLPDPWIQVVSIFPRRKMFKRSYAESSIVLDPRLRAFPSTAKMTPAAVRNKEYMEAYNADHSSCSQYWGHQGRQWRSNFLTIPTLFRVGFISLAAPLYLKGVRCIISYPIGIEIGGSDESRRRLDHIRYSKLLLLAYIGPQLIINILYAVASGGSMLKLWLECVLRYTEMEKQGERSV